MGAERIYKDNSQLRIEDFVFPYGKLDPENDWVELAALVPWEVAEERYAARFVNNGHPAHPARMALGALPASPNHFPDSVSHMETQNPRSAVACCPYTSDTPP